MVGVAGKSKACNTCRKRKIACDLQRPQCSQCIKANRVCTGYQRKRIFIFHQGTQGESSEEIRNGNPKSDSTSHSDITTSCQEDEAAQLPIRTRGRRASPRPAVQLSLVHCNSNLSPAIYRKQLFNTFLCCHMPASQIQSLGKPWLILIPDLAFPTDALEASSLALATSRLGRSNNDPVLLRESLRLYTLGIRQLQKALWDPTLMYRDETLAACMALAMYEITECPSKDASGYLSHCNGLETLVRLRGPEAHMNGLGHHVFLMSRIHLTLQDLQRHRKSYISNTAWTTIPWNNIPKTEFDQIFDLFSRGPATFEAVDRLDGAESLERLRIALEITEDCLRLDSDIERFYESLEQGTLGPLYWPEFTKSDYSHRQNHNHDDSSKGTGSLFTIAFHFPNLGTARTVLFYWATLTMLWSGLSQLYGLIYSLKDSVIDDDNDESELAFRIARLPPLDHRKDFASLGRNVCQSVEYCLQEEMLSVGPMVIAAPLKMVIDTMKQYESFSTEISWASAVIRRISEDGLRILV